MLAALGVSTKNECKYTSKNLVYPKPIRTVTNKAFDHRVSSGACFEVANIDCYAAGEEARHQFRASSAEATNGRRCDDFSPL